MATLRQAVIIALFLWLLPQTTPARSAAYGHEDLVDGIYLVEPFQKDQVLLHFNTRANASYILEWTPTLPGDPLGTPVWSTLYEAPFLPFPNHYIVVDTRSDRHRFYRLRIRS